MKKGASSQTGKSRFHPSRISGQAKFRRALDVNRILEESKKKPRGKMFETVKELFK